MDKIQATGKMWEMISLSETKLEEMEEQGERVVDYTNKQLVRIYPKVFIFCMYFF